MDTIKSILLVLHVIGGGTALIAGLIPMIAKKGGNLHRTGGQIFTWAMWVAVGSGLPLSLMCGSVFLGAVGVFTAYLIYTGQRSVIRHSVVPTGPDLWVARLALFTGILMVGFGLWLILGAKGSWGGGIILTLFGAFLSRMALEDLQAGRMQPEKSWMLFHLARMGGAYIATLTAFLVTNASEFHPLILWLGPTIIGTFVIGRVSSHWRKKLSSSSAPTSGFLPEPSLDTKVEREIKEIQ